LLSVFEFACGVLEVLVDGLEFIGQVLSVTDSSEDPAQLRGRWPAILLFWFLAGLALAFGISVLAKPASGPAVQGFAWFAATVPPLLVGLITWRWHSLAWPRGRG
jgi:hypothetical protein